MSCLNFQIWLLRQQYSHYRRTLLSILVMLVVKNLLANPGDLRDAGSILGSGRSPGGGNGNPLLCSCLENPTGRGAWRATVRSIRLSTHTWMGPMKSSRKDGFVKSGWADQTLELLMGMCSRNVPVFTHYLFAWCWEWWFQKSPLCLSRQLSISKQVGGSLVYNAQLQALLSVGFSRQEYRSGLPFPPPGDLPDPGVKLASPALAGRFCTAEPPGKP